MNLQVNTGVSFPELMGLPDQAEPQEHPALQEPVVLRVRREPLAQVALRAAQVVVERMGLQG
jgi:hypothetical protein